MINKRIVLGIFSCFFALASHAQTGIWQWSVPVRNFSSNPKNPEANAYLWIPERCGHVKAVLVAQHNMEEIQILEDTAFRRRMAEMDVAQVWICPSFNHGFDFTDGAWETLDSILKDLARESGYEELAKASLIAIGHSAAASWPYYLAAYKPDRTLACISISGQWPYYRDNGLCPDIWGDRHIDQIPCLETMGEYESAHTWSDRGLRDRSEHPQLPLSMLACPAEGHFAYTAEKAQYIAFYIKKALQYGHANPTTNGWLMERWKKNEGPSYEPAPVGQYKGDPSRAFWFFDRELIDSTVAYQSRYRNMQPQLVGVSQNGEVVRQRNSHLQIHPKFLPLEDGVSFQLSPIFLDTVPSESPRLSEWTGLPAGYHIGHAKNGNPSLQMITGPAVLEDSVTFRIQWNRGTLWTASCADIIFSINHPGDETYKPAVQQAQITIPVRLTEGQYQKIEFAKLSDVQCGINNMPLNAVSNSGLPVGFYVESGPAYVKDNKLIFTPIPPKTIYPIKVTIVAWQYGRKTSPQIQTAEPVRQTFYIK